SRPPEHKDRPAFRYERGTFFLPRRRALGRRGESVIDGDGDRARVGPGAREIVAGEATRVDQDPLRGVRGEGLERPRQEEDRGDQRLGVGGVELPLLLQLLL